MPCPLHSAPGHLACMCDPDYYNEVLVASSGAAQGVRCAACMAGTNCNTSGNTLVSLPLLPGWWRVHTRSTDVRKCPRFGGQNSTGCIGGWGALCKPGLTGPYCQLCVNKTGHFYDMRKGECASCDAAGGQMRLFAILLGVVVPVALFAVQRLGPRFLFAVEGRCGVQLSRWAPPRDWLRILWGTYQVITKLPAVCQLGSLPASVSDLLALLTMAVDVGFESFSGVPLQCIGMQGFLARLIFYVVVPPTVLMLASPFIKRISGSERRRPQTWSKQMLPAALIISYLALPMVSTLAFRAFISEAFTEEGGREVAYLKADYSVQIGSSQDSSIKAWASIAIVLYPVGIPIWYAILLFKVRHKVSTDVYSELSDAVSFLHGVFKPQFYW